MEVRDKVLVVEDDAGICNVMVAVLSTNRYEVLTAANGRQADTLIRSHCPDLVLLDLGLPDLDGLELIQRVRSWSGMPIVVVSARSQEADKVAALDAGADDYIVKPFDAKEVIARINAVTRRVGMGNTEPEIKEVHYDKLSVNMTRYELKVNGKVIDTPPKELELLFYLASNPNRVYTRDQLLDEVWGFEYYGDSRTIDVHIKRLREKLEGVSDKWTLKTVWGVGYKFEAGEDE